MGPSRLVGVIALALGVLATPFVAHAQSPGKIPRKGGDWPAVGQAARVLERANVEVIYAFTTQVTLGVKGATTKVPIVFFVGVDPVAAGLVESYAKPGGRLS